MNLDVCMICGKQTKVIMVDEYVEDHEIAVTEEPYCLEHYKDALDNVFEIPAERLKVLE